MSFPCQTADERRENKRLDRIASELRHLRFIRQLATAEKIHLLLSRTADKRAEQRRIAARRN